MIIYQMTADLYLDMFSGTDISKLAKWLIQPWLSLRDLTSRKHHHYALCALFLVVWNVSDLNSRGQHSSPKVVAMLHLWEVPFAYIMFPVLTCIVVWSWFSELIWSNVFVKMEKIENPSVGVGTLGTRFFESVLPPPLSSKNAFSLSTIFT